METLLLLAWQSHFFVYGRFVFGSLENEHPKRGKGALAYSLTTVISGRQLNRTGSIYVPRPTLT